MGVTMGYLASLRAAEACALAVGVHNGITARLGERCGFQALWLSSLEVSASMALPDMNLITMTEVAERVREIRRASGLPLLVDADNGYGSDELAVRAAVEYARSGAAAVCLEDKAFPKRNSFYEDDEQALEDCERFCERLRAVRAAVALEGREMDVIARCEALVAGRGPAEAVRRARAYRAAGADALFVQVTARDAGVYAGVLTEIRDLAPVVVVPTALANWSVTDLQAAGASVVIYANAVIRTIVKTVTEVLTDLRAELRLGAVEGDIASLDTLFEVTGHPSRRASGVAR
ncbi:MAG TPA: isocitrate lyase/phosphoenolpyruvate mutase family protein [Candidatus Dormibacteraeota bacterium]|nr:isocitrate lyase/phosphoenolpyruvate mutase family protein [Candidatus Dormibacteraeota bacterium]